MFEATNRAAGRATALEDPDLAVAVAESPDYAAFVDRCLHADDVRDYLRVSLEWAAQRLHSPLAAVRYAHDGETVLDCWQRSDRCAYSWQNVLEALLLECEADGEPLGRLLHEDEEGAWLGLATPLRARDDGVRGAMALVVVVDVPNAERLLGELSAFVASINAGLLGFERALHHQQDAKPDGEQPGVDAHEDPWHLSRAARFQSLTEYAFTLTDLLRARTSSEQVSFARIRRNRARIVSISGIDEPNLQSTGTLELRQAIEECVDAGHAIRYPEPIAADENRHARVYRLHRQWHLSSDMAALLTIPVHVEDRCAGVFSFRRHASQPFTCAETEHLSGMLTKLGTSIELLARAERGVVRHAADSLLDGLKGIRHGRQLLRHGIAAVLLAFFAWFFFATMPDRITVPCTVGAERMFHVSAPFEGRIVESVALPGRSFEVGEVLCRFDTRDIELREAELRAEIESLELEERQFVAAGDLAASKLAAARVRIVEAKIQSLERKIEHSTVRAPIDGIVLKGDLSKRIGQIVPQGEALFELAPTDVDITHLEIEVPEEHATALEVGVRTEFSSNARPEETLEYVVSRIDPSAQASKGRVVFVVEATPGGERAAEWVRVGMQGYARLELGRERVYRIALRRITNTVVRALWF